MEENIVEKNKKYINHKKIIALQIFFLGLVLTLVYFYYPRANMTINGNFVRFDSINANVIILSDSPNFYSPKYIDLREVKNVSIDFMPGKYYWRPYNQIIEGFTNEFEIDSKVGLKIDREDNSTDLVNIGNVKINVSKSKNGMMVGRIILDPEQEEEIEDTNEKYIGGQE
jgi:hypothetical protein